MKKYRWQLIILFLTGLVVGTLLFLERRGGFGEIGTPQPVEGGVYTEALIGNLERLNPLIDHINSPDRDVDRLIFSGLVKFDSLGLPENELAEKIGISQDGTLYNILLREDLKWHDGIDLTSKDIVFTIELMRAGDGIVPTDISQLWNSVEVIAFDDRNLQIKLPEPYSPFMDYLAFGILPEHVFGKMNLQQIVNSSLNLQPVGSGPYMFSELLMDGNEISGVKLKVFEDYAGTAPFLQEIIFRYYPDSQSAFQAYKDGYVQGIGKITSDQLSDALADANLSVYTGRLPQISMIMFNLNDQSLPFLQDANIRKALFLGINRTGLINEVFNGQAIQANSVILEGTWAYNKNIPVVDYNVEEAAILLKQAGYVITGEENPVRKKDDQELTFRLSYPDDPVHQQVAEYLEQNWKKLGIYISLQPVSPDVFVSEKLVTRDFEVALVDLDLSQNPDPDPYPFWDLGQAANGQNYTQWSNRLASDSIEQARVTVDFQERMRLYHNFQAIFAEDLPALPLYSPVYNYAIDAQIQGVSMGPLFDTRDRLATITNWYLVARVSNQAPETPEGN